MSERIIGTQDREGGGGEKSAQLEPLSRAERRFVWKWASRRSQKHRRGPNFSGNLDDSIQIHFIPPQSSPNALCTLPAASDLLAHRLTDAGSHAPRAGGLARQ